MGGAVHNLSGDAPRRGWLTAVRHAACVLALMWTGIVNGQPFFFADTTNYIRAADMAVFIASGRTISTVWTARYRAELPDKQGQQPQQAPPRKEAAQAESMNVLSKGLVMSGRSPYIGALMYAGWVTGEFWPFVLLQAIIAYLLINMVLRLFRLNTPGVVTAVTFGLALTTSLPTYNSLLLADAFASFGIVAFALLALDNRLSRLEFLFLLGILVMSVISHLTHLTMLIAMTAVVALLWLKRWLRPSRQFWIAAVGGIVAAVAGIQATAIATRMAIGNEPQLLPLLTARFYVDGPGQAFVKDGCEGNRFEVCRVPIKAPVNESAWLFSADPETGAYLLATPEQRRLMGEQDVAFALAVLRAYPLQQTGAMITNTALQLVTFNYANLNQGCAERPGCWENLPPVVRAQFDQSLSGRNLWPQQAMDILLHMVVIGSLITLIIAMVALSRRDEETFGQLRNLLLIAGGAMLMCCFFGGAVGDPQYRYQGRLIWLPVFFAIIAVLAARRAGWHWPLSSSVRPEIG